MLGCFGFFGGLFVLVFCLFVCFVCLVGWLVLFPKGIHCLDLDVWEVNMLSFGMVMGEKTP